MAPFVTIVVPTRDNLAMIRQVTAGILAYTVPPFEIVIVDNASTDPEVTAFLAVIATAPAVRVMRMPTNVYYWPAINVGIRAAAAAAEYVLALNDDVLIQGSDWLPRLLAAFADDPAVGYVGDLQAIDGCPRLGEVVDGYCALFRRRLFDDVGLFDEHWPFFWGFVDFQLRARRRGYRGRDIKASGDATDRIEGVVYHLRGRTLAQVRGGLDRRTQHRLFGSPWTPARVLWRNGYYRDAVASAVAVGRGRITERATRAFSRA